MEVILKKQFIKEVSKLPFKVQMSIKGILDDLEKVQTIQDLDIDLKRMEGRRELL